MKKYLRYSFTACFLFFAAVSFANSVIVKGYVKDSANHAVANKTIRIYNNDSTNQGCLIAHTVVTNPNGYYIDTLSCNSDIRKLLVVVESCNGQRIIRDPAAVSAPNMVEVNFVICVTPGTAPAQCKAILQYTLTTAGVKFTSGLSEAPAGDSIIARTWNFGDSTAPLTGNQKDPVHAYNKSGNYNVCLSIKTKNGCESKYCTTVEYKLPAPCFAYVHVNVEPSSSRKFRFTSNTATTAAGDTIIKRTWTFGDGTTLTGNEVYPIKEYKDTGVYNVCVTVKTANGCEAQHCFTVVVRDTTSRNTACKAYFTATYKDSVVYFNSEGSKAGDGDSIISRTWYYTDANVGTLTLTGNVIDTFFRYMKPGTYKVYLVIKTKKGCESKYAGTVTVPQPPTACRLQPVITFEKISAHKFRFSSAQTSAAGDTIIKRSWKFGDGSGMDGNEISPLKEFKDTGVYNVCVTIKTKNGCEKQVCVNVVVRDSVPKPANCKACFTATYKDGIVYFNSACSVAPDGDSIISRTWYYTDSSLAAPLVLTGNVVDTSIQYNKAGNYTVYLVIKTKKGCESKYAGSVVIPAKPNTACKATFSFELQQFTVKFNSAASKAGDGDSIIARSWVFGDSSAILNNNVDPVHTYAKAGTYTVVLYIKTKSGCESRYEVKLVVPATPTICKVYAQFAATRVSGKKIQFNSIQSFALAGDSIVQRKWKFGDGTGLEGNVVSPVKEYDRPGLYNVCLQVRTARGCEAQECKQVAITDTSSRPQTDADFVKIISINPNPVVTRMLVTIWSRNIDAEVEIAVYDIYGTNKMSFKKVLGQGNNVVEIAVGNLYHGPYFLRVSSKHGKDSRAFYKL